MVTPSTIPGANGSSFPGRDDAIRGSYNFGTPTSPLSPEVPAKGPELSPLSTNNSAFEVQVLEKLARLSKQQQTDAETLLNVVDSRTSQIGNRLTILEKTVAHLLPVGPEDPDLAPFVEDMPLTVSEPTRTVHESLVGFNLENFVRINLLKRIHYGFSTSSREERGKLEVRPDDLRWGVREGLEKLDVGDKMELLTEYVNLFLKTRTFAMPKSIRKKYPKADFKAMGQFFSNASRALNKIINTGITN